MNLKLQAVLLEIFYLVTLKKHIIKNINEKCLGEKPQDVDLATNARPDDIVRIIEKNQIRIINKYGFTHGTVPVRVNDKVFN
jgi:hypothetical protein